MAGPLAHLTILDLSRVLAGPWCTQLLADLGATVIKIEKPGTGDDTRAWGPPFLKSEAGGDTDEAAYYLGCNRGKQSVAIDFTRPEGRDLVLSLAREADALVENFKVGGLAKYGLDYPHVATCSSKPFQMSCEIGNLSWTKRLPDFPTESLSVNPSPLSKAQLSRRLS